MRPTPGQRCENEQQKLSTSISRNLQWNLHRRATDVQPTCKVLHRHANILVAHPRVGRNTTYVDGKYRVAYVTPLAPSLSLTVPVTRKNRKSKQDSRNAGKPMTYLSSGIDSSMTTKKLNKQTACCVDVDMQVSSPLERKRQHQERLFGTSARYDKSQNTEHHTAG